jgi:hypothetical protein
VAAPGERLWLCVSKSIRMLKNVRNGMRSQAVPEGGELGSQSDLQLPLSPSASSEGATKTRQGIEIVARWICKLFLCRIGIVV